MQKSWFGLLVYYLKCSCSSDFRQSQRISREEGDSPPQDEQEEKKKNYGGWRCMPYIIGNETFEKVASTGLTANFTVYLVTYFGMQRVDAANLGNIFAGTTNFAPLLGAFISDAYWGRYRTLAFASVATFFGMVVLTMTAMVPQFHPPVCSQEDQLAMRCAKASKGQMGVLILSLGLLTLGAAGVRPCSLPFGVDQFDKNSEKGQQGLSSYFNWYYCTSTAGSLLAMTVVVYIQDSVSWPVGFGIPTVLMLFAIILFFLGTRIYVYVPPEGSVFSGIAQVIVAMIKKRKLPLPAPHDVVQQATQLYNPPCRSDRVTKLPLTLQYRFMNKAAIKCEGDLNEDGSLASPWRLCTVQQIEEVKLLMRIVPVWASGIACFVALGQQWTFAVLQSMTMDRHLGKHFQIPPATLGTIALMALTLFIPIYEKIFVPVARRFTGNPTGITLLQRQGVGMVIAVFSMIVAGLFEQKRRDSALAHGGGISPLSALWLSPQLILMGIAEAFNAVGQVEFYNKQFPEHMQTLAGSLFFCTIAGSSYISTFLVIIIRDNTTWLNNNINIGRVDYFYYVIAAMGVVNFIYFLFVSHFYRYKGTPEVEERTKKEEITA